MKYLATYINPKQKPLSFLLILFLSIVSFSQCTIAQDIKYIAVNVLNNLELESDRIAIMTLLNNRLNNAINADSCNSGLENNLAEQPQQLIQYLELNALANTYAQNNSTYMANNFGQEPDFDDVKFEFEDRLYDEEDIYAINSTPYYSSLSTNQYHALNELFDDNCQELIDIAINTAGIGIGKATMEDDKFYLTLIIFEWGSIVEQDLRLKQPTIPGQRPSFPNGFRNIKMTQTNSVLLKSFLSSKRFSTGVPLK